MPHPITLFRLARQLALGGLIALGLSACSQSPEIGNKAPAQPEQTLTKWLDAEYETELQFSPIELTFLGRKERNNEIDALTFAAFAEQLAWKQSSVAQMQRLFKREDLTSDEQLSFDLWTYQLERMQESEQFFYDGLVFDQMNGIQSFIPTFLINFHRVETAEDMRSYIERVKAVSPRMQEAIDNASRGATKGVVSQTFALDGTVVQARNVISGLPFENDAINNSDLWADMLQEIQALQDSDTIDEATARQLREQSRDALVNYLQPAYEKIIHWAENAKDTAPAVASGIGTQPGGAAFYEYRLRNQTTTDLSANEIHQIGLTEVARLRKEMEAVKASVGFDGSLQAFFELVRDSEWNYYPDTDEGRRLISTMPPRPLMASRRNYLTFLASCPTPT